MKEVQTTDGVIIKYIKNEEKSINGVCNVFDLYDKEDNLLGNRIGVQDLKKVEYKDLFDDNDKLIYDPHGKLEGKKTKSVAETKEPKPKKEQAPGTLSVDKLPTGGYETMLKFRVTIKSKRKVIVDELIQHLGKKWTIIGYEVTSQTKDVGGEDGEQNDNTDERTTSESATEV